MKYLLDTHVLIWYLYDEEKLSKNVANVLRRLDLDIFISAVNFWEISIKYDIGKLDLKNLSPDDLLRHCMDLGFKMLPLSAEDTSSFYQLSVKHHKDPFDRILIWQAIRNNMVLVTNDQNMKPYDSDGLQLLW